MARQERRWLEWASFGLGLWLALSPWVAGYAHHAAATANAVFVGLALSLVSHFQALDECQGRWIALAAGLWLMIAPFYLGFGDAVAMAASISAGALVGGLACAALSLGRQDAH
jgi:hypothetical protein